MRRDIYIGMTVSLAIHAGFALLRPSAVPVITKDPEEIITTRIPMPPLELDEPKPIIDERPASRPDVAPPEEPEQLLVAPPNVPVQLPRPPNPEGIQTKGMVTIPADPGSGGLGSGLKIFTPDLLDRQPQPTYQAKPVYPFEQRRTGITGQVVVGFVVDARGSVREAYAISSTQREFESAAVLAVSKWTFKPGRKDGVAVNVRMQVPIVFSISSEP